ncbi:MAG: hypothetical protein PHV97_00165 [Candidatus Omnitrophica bacterium]|nr:hypothetical protein [Candidatus Omnitrophota bacterium]
MDLIASFKKGTGWFSHKNSLSFLFFTVLCLSVLSGCGSATYPEARCKEALQEIALKEYNIPHIEVEFVGTTLGVFLPLDKLFSADLKEALMSGKVTDMESLFQPTEEAIDKVENILFSMSRVMLSTDKKFEFYYLQATDVEKSGMDLTFIGQIDDLKRVRFWDIPRSEYRKRIIHDLHMNRAALWHRPVRHFFKDLNEAAVNDIQDRYFPKTAEAKWTKEFFFTDDTGTVLSRGRAKWTILDLRSIPIQDNDIVVYAKVEIAPKDPTDTNLKPKVMEYLFQVSTAGDTEKIRRIIPMAYLDDKTATPDFTFTRDMVAKSLPNWETEFKTPDISMGEFLARQFTRRFQTTAAEDERIANTFPTVKLVVRFDPEPKKCFLFNAVAPLRNPKEVPYAPERGLHEDVLYFWDRVAREFVEVLRSYSFEDYKSLKFQLSQDEKLLTWTATREDLELFRRHKKTLPEILALSADNG